MTGETYSVYHFNENKRNNTVKTKQIKFAPYDRVNCITHLTGAVLSVVATILFLIKSLSLSEFDPIKTFSTLAFGISLIALYTASATYHYVSTDSKHWMQLKRLDHSMIYVLIAGSYTPVLLTMPDKSKGIMMSVAIWIIGLSGVCLKVFCSNVPRVFSTVLYIAMGWFILIDTSVLTAMNHNCIALIAIGGVLYTIGGVIYAIKKPNISKTWGFHEIFHLFVMAGSLCHVLSTYIYIL